MTRLWRSRALREVGYDAATRTLRIDFLNGGRYEYLDVGPEVYEGMIHSAHRGPNGAKRCWGTSTAGSTERAGAPVRIGRGHRDGVRRRPRPRNPRRSMVSGCRRR